MTSDNCLSCDGERDITNDCKCNDGYYEVYPDCIQCNYKCEKCTADDVCTACTDVNRVVGTCECKDGWIDVGVAECEECSVNCETCTDTVDNCDKCDATRVQGSEPDCPCPDG